MTTFQSVNMNLGPRSHTTEVSTPTTPRAFLDSTNTPLSPPAQLKEESAPTTPTRHSFTGKSAKRALPTSPFSNTFPAPQQTASQLHQGSLSRADSQRSTQSTGSQDVDMDDSDEAEDGSDAESIDGETGRPSKKKKGQRFYCTDYPPCNLSFTRSEHLARHIRKHTGERPFQCHCARRFSRLDNLRQHAQTVHVNEEIPGDSLAATGTRFQRQIRTDRVRPPGARSRASTSGSQGSHARGHSRNLSASSTTSTASTISRDDSRRRPPPLMMAHDPSARARLTLDTMRSQMSTPPGNYTYANQSSAGPSTPTSTTYSNAPSSPYGSSVGSPMSSVSRPVGHWGAPPTGRRQSVPNGTNPFQPPHGPMQAAPYLSPLMPSNSSHFSGTSSILASPTGSSYSFARNESAIAAEAELRRRTWHPSTYSSYQRPATSGLSHYSTTDASSSPFVPQAINPVSQTQRLPGIESFTQMYHPPRTPPRQGPGALAPETPPRSSMYSPVTERSAPGPDDRRGHLSWDMSLHQGLTKLDIANNSPKEPGQWGLQVLAEIQTAASRTSQLLPTQQPLTSHPPFSQQNMPSSHPNSSQQPVSSQQPMPSIQPTASQQPMPSQQPTSSQQSMPSQQLKPLPQSIQPSPIKREPQKRTTEVEHYPKPAAPNRSRRQAWYNGPLQPSPATVTLAHRTSPEDSSSSEGVPTPSAASAECHPSIVHANGYIEASNPNHGASSAFAGFMNNGTRHTVYPVQHDPSRSFGIVKSTDMSGLEALVAVATSEEKAVPTTH